MAHPNTKVTDHGPGKASLHVVHKCGHTSDLSYGSKAAADADIAKQEAGVCWPCHNSAMVKANEAARNAASSRR